MPSLAEQKAIVEKANAVMALFDTLEKETHQTTKEDWMKSCLKEVFEGNGEDEFDEESEPNLECPSCHYKAHSDCLGYRGTYCHPAVCNKCNNIYDVNSEYCGEPEQVNACDHCGAHDYKDWDQKKRPCPKCGVKMDVLNQILKS